MQPRLSRKMHNLVKVRATSMVGTLQGMPTLPHNQVVYYFLYVLSFPLLLAPFFRKTLQLLASQYVNFTNFTKKYLIRKNNLCIIGITNEIVTLFYEMPIFGTQVSAPITFQPLQWNKGVKVMPRDVGTRMLQEKVLFKTASVSG